MQHKWPIYCSKFSNLQGLPNFHGTDPKNSHTWKNLKRQTCKMMFGFWCHFLTEGTAWKPSELFWGLSVLLIVHLPLMFPSRWDSLVFPPNENKKQKQRFGFPGVPLLSSSSSLPSSAKSSISSLYSLSRIIQWGRRVWWTNCHSQFLTFCCFADWDIYVSGANLQNLWLREVESRSPLWIFASVVLDRQGPCKMLWTIPENKAWKCSFFSQKITACQQVLAKS